MNQDSLIPKFLINTRISGLKIITKSATSVSNILVEFSLSSVSNGIYLTLFPNIYYLNI